MRKDPSDTTLATNRKAYHDYEIVEKLEAGIQLAGSEVKSCRSRAVQLQEGFVRIENGEALLYNVHIAEYEYSNRFNHRVKQIRRLLLHKREILKLAQWINTRGGTVIPLKFYLKQGLVKVEIAYCRGKTHADMRETMRKRDADMEMRRELGTRRKHEG